MDMSSGITKVDHDHDGSSWNNSINGDMESSEVLTVSMWGSGSDSVDVLAAASFDHMHHLLTIPSDIDLMEPITSVSDISINSDAFDFDDLISVALGFPSSSSSSSSMENSPIIDHNYANNLAAASANNANCPPIDTLSANSSTTSWISAAADHNFRSSSSHSSLSEDYLTEAQPAAAAADDQDHNYLISRRMMNAFPFMLSESDYRDLHMHQLASGASAAQAQLHPINQLHRRLHRYEEAQHDLAAAADTSAAAADHRRPWSTAGAAASSSIISFRPSTTSDLIRFRRSQRRKRDIQNKKGVTIVPSLGSIHDQLGDCIPPDSWTWRKYGQKPIKGSRHPRSYYRCTVVKGCKARKRVERWLLDPHMIEITYFCDHTHMTHNNNNSSTNVSEEFETDDENNENSGDYKRDISNDESTLERSNNIKTKVLNEIGASHDKKEISKSRCYHTT